MFSLLYLSCGYHTPHVCSYADMCAYIPNGLAATLSLCLVLYAGEGLES